MINLTRYFKVIGWGELRLVIERTENARLRPEFGRRHAGAIAWGQGGFITRTFIGERADSVVVTLKL